MPKKKVHQAPRKKSLFNKMGRFFLLLFVWGLLSLFAVGLWLIYDLPSVQHLQPKAKKHSIIYLTASHEEIAHEGDVYGRTLSATEMPDFLKKAVIAVEDQRFYEHQGIDMRGVLRAVYVNIKAVRVVQGASSLTQQVAKNLFLTNKRTFKRKLQEIVLTLWLEYHFSKSQLLSIYLNRVYFGHGVYGVDAAAQEYFGKPVEAISKAEMCVLAGMLKGPNRYSPLRAPEKIKKRARVVARLLKMQGEISKTGYHKLRQQIQDLTFHQSRKGSHARYFTDWIKSQLPDLVNMEQDLMVITTLSMPLQNNFSKAFDRILSPLEKRQNIQQQAGVILSYDGAVRAMIGGKNYWNSMFNRVTQAKRQTGSVFKPFVFLAAFEAGLTPQTLIEDGPVKIGKWAPKNFGWRMRGKVRLDRALSQSINTATVRLAQKIGIKPIQELVRRLGIYEPMPNDLTLSLGSAETSVLDITNAYTIIANGGTLTAPYGILEVRTRDGTLLYKHKKATLKSVIPHRAILHIQHTLQHTARHGTARKSFVEGITLGAKTGTTQNHKDAWFIGYTPHLTIGIWVGNDNGAPMKGVTGSRAPQQIWQYLLKHFYKRPDSLKE